MTRKSIGLLSMAVACAAIISISASSCDNNPTTPGNQNTNGKTPQVLDGECVGTVAVTDCGVGKATVAYDEDGYLTVSGMRDPGKSGVNCRFSLPINVWNANIRVRFPDDGTGSLSYTAQDDQGNTEARLDIAQVNGQYQLLPTFTSPPEGGKASYDVAILDNDGNVVASQIAIDPKKPIVAQSDCDIRLNTFQGASWSVYQINSQCIWKVLTNPCCRVRWILPNGTIADGTKIQFRERNEKGLYVYLETKNIFTSGNVLNYNVLSASAIKTAR